MSPNRIVVVSALATALAACASAPPPKPPEPVPQHRVQRAEAKMAPASASLVSGRLAITALDGGVRIHGELGGLAKGGTHAIHVHERGDCSAADGSAAGAHFNPAGTAHGRAGVDPHHLGDMDNLHANGQGVAHVDIRLQGVTLGSGAANDILGRAIIVHANPDDYASQPAGNAGARVACGVIEIAM
jgi:superoxide dismutase, Cu-Zn family